MIAAAFALPDTTVGMIEASATRKPPIPCTEFGVDYRQRVATHLG